ncbi:MAG: hypothetical protein V3T86_15735 [Planctomycetota bacterium]
MNSANTFRLPGALATAVMLALAATPATAETFESADKNVRITIPDEWQPRDRKEPKDNQFMRLTFTAPGEELGYCYVNDRRGEALVERAQAFFDMGAPVLTKNRQTKVLKDPAVHTVSYAGATDYVAIFYRSIRGNMISVRFRVDLSTYEQYLTELAAISKSVVADLPSSPHIPEGYRKTNLRGFLVLQHDTVKGKCNTIRRELANGIKRFEAIHGMLPSPRHALPQLIVLTEFSQMKDVGAGLVDADFHSDPANLRMFCKALGKHPEQNQVVMFHRALHELLHAVTYAVYEPMWLNVGLRNVEASYVACGKKLPFVANGYLVDLPRRNFTFTRMRDLRDKDFDTFSANAFFYAAFFQAGPKKYREAFEAFLVDLRATGDWRTCERSHILTFDQAEMQADAQKFLKKLKPARDK